MTTIVMFFILITLIILAKHIEMPTNNLSNYNTAKKKYEDTGVSIQKVQRAYDRLTYEEKQKLKKNK